MRHENGLLEPTYGYLSALESAEHGFFGGYLIISDWGRPLEFHCTAPVWPSRAQQILYGPTLRPYLLGGQIGPVLLGKAKLTPQIILTDQADMLCLHSRGTIPMVLVVGPEDAPTTEGRPTIAGWTATASTSDASSNRQPIGVGPPTRELPLTGTLCVAGCQLRFPPGFHADRQTALELLERLSSHVDLAEPFERIHEAIREAQRIGGRGPDAYGQAA